MNKFLNRTARLGAWLGYASFACKILVPIGYMPAALDEGGPFVLCPGGYQGELVRYLSGHQPGHGASGSHDAAAAEHGPNDGSSNCSLGTTLGAVAPDVSSSIPLALVRAGVPAASADARVVAAPATRYHSRAPPLTV